MDANFLCERVKQLILLNTNDELKENAVQKLKECI